MIKLTIWYSDGTKRTRTFASLEEANWFFHNEGDHAVDFKIEKSDKDEGVNS